MTKDDNKIVIQELITTYNMHVQKSKEVKKQVEAQSTHLVFLKAELMWHKRVKKSCKVLLAEYMSNAEWSIMFPPKKSR